MVVTICHICNWNRKNREQICVELYTLSYTKLCFFFVPLFQVCIFVIKCVSILIESNVSPTAVLEKNDRIIYVMIVLVESNDHKWTICHRNDWTNEVQMATRWTNVTNRVEKKIEIERGRVPMLMYDTLSFRATVINGFLNSVTCVDTFSNGANLIQEHKTTTTTNTAAASHHSPGKQTKGFGGRLWNEGKTVANMNRLLTALCK